MNNGSKSALADSVGGKILIGVAIAAISGLLGVLGGWIVARDAPPVAALEPSELTVAPDEVVQFSAEASNDPEGGDISFVWSVGGTELEESPIARCSANGAVAECRFISSGTFGVGVKVMDEGGLSSSAVGYVSVVIEGGYIGLRVVERAENSDAMYRALLSAVDWLEVQAHSPRLLVFYDPDKGRAVYAASAAAKADADLSVLQGAKIMVPFSSGRAFDVIREGLEQAGASVVSMPADQVILALQSGAGEVGFVPMSKPGSICELTSRC